MPLPITLNAPVSARLRLLPRLATVLLCLVAPLRAGWGEDAIKKECDYIVNCSFTSYAVNNSQVHDTDAAFGAINVLRIADKGADWVNPGESAIAAIGLMAGARKLHQDGAYAADVQRYNKVLSAFFNKWVAGPNSGLFVSGTPAETNTSGGARKRVYYSTEGAYQAGDAPEASVTGQILAASWKYYEYLRATSTPAAAQAWFDLSQETFVPNATRFLYNSYNWTLKMVASNPTLRENDYWISDSVWGEVGFNVAAKYRAGVQDGWRFYDYEEAFFKARAADVRDALSSSQMKDTGGWKGFYRVRDHNYPWGAEYGENIDQLCFLPYETNTLPVSENFCGEVSDWWTNGGYMTPNPTDSGKWTYYGTKWKHFFAPSAVNVRLTPGPGLQLALVEWKHYKATNNTIYRQRAEYRLSFADNRSTLWLGSAGNVSNNAEAGVANGIIDWRNENDSQTEPNPENFAGRWERFADTSAYFIMVVLMVVFDTDTVYQPEINHQP